MGKKLPNLTGKQLIRLLEKDGFSFKRQKGSHASLSKILENGIKIVTVVPDTKDDLPKGTLMEILGIKQTGLGHSGLLRLIEKYGIK